MKTRIRYVSYDDTSGYSSAARAYISYLSKNNVDVVWTPLNSEKNLFVNAKQRWMSDHLELAFNRSIDYDAIIVHTFPHDYDRFIDEARVKNVKVFLYSVWELDILPDGWAEIINKSDGLMVPCEWNKEIYQKNGVTVPVCVVPHISNYEDFNLDSSHYFQHDLIPSNIKKKVVFYAIATWFPRKGLSELIQAYLTEFNSADDVLLVLKTSTHDYTSPRRLLKNLFRSRFLPVEDSLAKILSNKKNSPAIHLISKHLSDEEIYALHMMCTCYVSLSRVEGFGLGLYDAAFLNKNIIAVPYGGQIDYLKHADYLSVDYELHDIKKSNGWDMGDVRGVWALPNISSAAAKMRNFYEAYQSSCCVVVDNTELRNIFSSKVIVKKIIDFISDNVSD